MSSTVTYPVRTHDALGLVWRCLVVGLGFVVFTMLGGILGQLLGQPVPAVASRIDMAQYLPATFIAGTAIGLVLGSLVTRLKLSAIENTGILGVTIAWLLGTGPWQNTHIPK
ncbi:MAG: hypothetical protein HY326_11900 [Chloroflexi bacterium]|nr:hypothetical protein [Chloroflexota bacterium]